MWGGWEEEIKIVIEELEVNKKHEEIKEELK